LTITCFVPACDSPKKKKESKNKWQWKQLGMASKLENIKIYKIIKKYIQKLNNILLQSNMKRNIK